MWFIGGKALYKYYITLHSYILRVVLVIIMEFHWFIGHVLLKRTVYYSPVDAQVRVAYNSHRCFG